MLTQSETITPNFRVLRLLLMKCRGQGCPRSSIMSKVYKKDGGDFEDVYHLKSTLPLTAFDLGGAGRCQEICHTGKYLTLALTATAHDQHMQLTAIHLRGCITIDTFLLRESMAIDLVSRPLPK